MFNIPFNSSFRINQLKWLSISIISIFFLLITNACNLSNTQQQSSADPTEDTVDIFIEPAGAKPLVFLGEGGTKICRRGLPDESDYGLEPDEIQEEETTTEGETGETTQPLQRFLTVDVGDNWFQMGLLIVNKSKNYYLVVEQLTFIISANWGNELLIQRPTLSSGYCSSSPLYIIPPTPKNAKAAAYAGDRYKPLKKNYINNLTLFVSGVPIPEGPPVQKKEGGAEDTLNDIRANADEATQNTPRAPEEFILTYLPTYKVELVLTGYWIDKERNNVANFGKKINFSLSSQFLD